MKLLFKFFIIVSIMFMGLIKTEAASFQEGYAQLDKKPMVLLIYAEWVNNHAAYTGAIDKLQKEHGNKYNFVKLNIAHNDAAAFNEKFSFGSKLPYVIMFRGGGKSSRYVSGPCTLDYSCINTKLKMFLQ